jgi:hypothetical protein
VIRHSWLTEAAANEFNIESAIDLACHMVQNAGRLWYHLSTVDRRQRLQRALFPDGLVYDQDRRFGTAPSSWPVEALREPDTSGNRMAPLGGPDWNRLVDWLRGVNCIADILRAA